MASSLYGEPYRACKGTYSPSTPFLFGRQAARKYAEELQNFLLQKIKKEVDFMRKRNFGLSIRLTEEELKCAAKNKSQYERFYSKMYV